MNQQLRGSCNCENNNSRKYDYIGHGLNIQPKEMRQHKRRGHERVGSESTVTLRNEDTYYIHNNFSFFYALEQSPLVSDATRIYFCDVFF